MKINKIFAGLIILMLLLLVQPAAASDYMLEIYGNANEDDTINMQDVTYTELIILEYKEQTQLADARYDDEIDILDVTQIELIILGREKELTLIDSGDRTVTVKKPIESTVICFPHVLETLRSLKVPVENIVGVAKHWPEYDPDFFPEVSNIPDVGDRWTPDVEEILTIQPDAVIFTALSAFVDTTPTVEVLGQGAPRGYQLKGRSTVYTEGKFFEEAEKIVEEMRIKRPQHPDLKVKSAVVVEVEEIYSTVLRKEEK